MNKFIIEKAIIEKTDKDINTACEYSFVSGLNLICGANEVGKSSLINFINSALLLKDGGDIGKIFLNFGGENYIVETKIKSSKNVVYNLSDNKKIDNKILKDIIPFKEFSNVFSINIDDLMCIREKDAKTFISLMRDSSCEYLNSYIEKTTDNVNKVLGTRNVINDAAKLKAEIISFNKEIKEYSNSESNYNNVISALSSINEELGTLYSMEEYLLIIDKITKLNEKIKEIENEYKVLEINFNSNFVEHSSEYLKLNEKSLNYNHNIEKLKENRTRIDELNSKVLFIINKLKKEFYLELSETKLNDFIVDYSKVRQITTSIGKLKDISDNLKLYNGDKKSLEYEIINIDKKIDVLNSKYKFSNSIQELDELHKYLDENLKYYNYLQAQINELETQVVVNSNGIMPNKVLLFASCLIAILTVTSSILAFYNKNYVLGAIATVIFLLSGLVICLLNISINKTNGLSELENNKIAKNKIVEDLKLKLEDVSPEILNINKSLMMLKISDLKQEVFTKKEQLKEKLQEKNEKNENLNEVVENIKKLEVDKNIIERNNSEIIKSDFEKGELSECEYLQVIELIENVKTILCEKVKIENINNDLIAQNEEIQNEFKNFIMENKIEIPFNEDFSSKIEQLKLYYTENYKLKEKLESLKIKIDSYKEEKSELENKKNNSNFEKVMSPAELEIEISYKNKQKEELLGQKHSLEHISGLDDLKIKRNIAQIKYDNKILKLFKEKIMLALCEKAKVNFDKKQPNLQKAQEFLSIMTDGKYTKINLENEIIQNDDCTRIKEWKNLSRGTKELLYFSLRLGFASNYSKDKVTLEPNGKLDLPLIIDDAFVNFDAIRTKNAIKCLAEFSKNNQVLFFTCHTDSMKKYFRELSEDTNVVILH